MNFIRTSSILGLLLLAACDEPKPTTNTTTAAASGSATTAPTAPTASAAATTTASAAAATGTAATFETATYDVDPAHSTVGFGVKHLMISTVKGLFDKVSGTLQTDADLAKAALNIEVDTTTVNTHNADRDKHLKSPDFFDTAKFPKMTFKSTKIERAGAGFKVTGDLKIKDVTKSVVLDVDSVTPETKDPFAGASHRGAHATTKINRQDYNLKWSKVLEAGGTMVGDEVTIELDVEFTKKKA